MLKMPVLKILLLKKSKRKQCIEIIYYKWKSSFFGRDDTKQAKELICIVFNIGQALILDKNNILLSDPAPFFENYTKLYFHAKHLETGSNRE